MSCERCAHWIVASVTKYGDGTVIENSRCPDGKGKCDTLTIETPAGFHCSSFLEGDDHVVTQFKSGAPWQNFSMGHCPDCRGNGSHNVELRPACNRCAGTAQVRYYDDGFVGEERTRLHPKEIAKPPQCGGCQRTVEKEWKRCPWCGGSLYPESSTQVVTDASLGAVAS